MLAVEPRLGCSRGWGCSHCDGGGKEREEGGLNYSVRSHGAIAAYGSRGAARVLPVAPSGNNTEAQDSSNNARQLTESLWTAAASEARRRFPWRQRYPDPICLVILQSGYPEQARKVPKRPFFRTMGRPQFSQYSSSPCSATSTSVLSGSRV